MAPFQLWVYGPIHTPIQLFIHQFNCSYTHSFLMLHGTFHIRNPFLKNGSFQYGYTPVFACDPLLTPWIPKSFHVAARFWSKVTSQDFVGFFFRGRILMEEIWGWNGWNLRSKNPLWIYTVFHMVKTRKKWQPEDVFFEERILFSRFHVKLGEC